MGVLMQKKKKIKLKFLYGKDFWCEGTLSHLLSKAKKKTKGLGVVL